MKGLGAAVKNGLDTVNAGDWSTIAGTNGNFGLEEGAISVALDIFQLITSPAVTDLIDYFL